MKHKAIEMNVEREKCMQRESIFRVAHKKSTYVCRFSNIFKQKEKIYLNEKSRVNGKHVSTKISVTVTRTELLNRKRSMDDNSSSTHELQLGQIC